MVIIFPMNANNLFTVEYPTAAVLSRGEVQIHQTFYGNDGILFGFTVGLIDNIQAGVTYGGTHIVGNQEPDWNKIPGVNVKFRIINETLTFPAIALGIDTQGRGKYYRDINRYDIKSHGVYAVASKNFSLYGLLGFDFGMNYTFEWEEDENKTVDFFAGTYKTLGDIVTIYLDYSLGLNDRLNDEEVDIERRNRGFLNSAIQVRLSDQLSIKLLLHDLMLKRKDAELFDRSILVDYRWFF